jgi:hypothetical protein
MMTLSIAEKYSRYPAGRYPSDGPFNGERFRNQLLVPEIKRAVAAGDQLIVELDGAVYSSSFLEEAFGGLVRTKELPPQAIRKTLKIRANDVAYQAAKLDAERYLEEALARE